MFVRRFRSGESHGMGISTITMRDSAGRDRVLPSTLRGEGVETPLDVQLPAVIEPTLFDISPNLPA